MKVGAVLWGCVASALSFGCSGDDDDDVAVDAGHDGDVGGEVWTVVYDPYEDGWLLSAWGSGPDDVWFVGGPEDGPIVLHWDGTRYERATIEGTASLWWMWGSGDGVFVAVGEGAQIFRSDDGGETFVAQPSPLAEATYWGVWGSSVDDVWIAGQEPQPDLTQRGVLLHSVDGGPFEEVDVGDERRALFKVWGAAADDVWAVGETGTLLHWDGVRWSDEDSGTNVRLFTISGCSADDIWIVGGFGNGVVLHREGGQWVDRSPPFAPPINGVSCAPGAVWVVGMAGYMARRIGEGWEEVADPPSHLDLHGAWTSGPHDAFAVGGNLMTGAGQAREGVLLRWGPLN